MMGLDVQRRAVVAGNQVAHAFVCAQVKRGIQFVGRFFRVVGRKEGKQPLQDVHGVRVAVRYEMDVAGHGGVNGRREPMSSIVHFSYVTCSITLGPVMYMPALPELRMMMKSVRAGE